MKILSFAKWSCAVFIPHLCCDVFSSELSCYLSNYSNSSYEVLTFLIVLSNVKLCVRFLFCHTKTKCCVVASVIALLRSNQNHWGLDDSLLWSRFGMYKYNSLKSLVKKTTSYLVEPIFCSSLFFLWEVRCPNRRYSYTRYRTGTSLQLRLTRGKWYSPHEPPLQASSRHYREYECSTSFGFRRTTGEYPGTCSVHNPF